VLQKQILLIVVGAVSLLRAQEGISFDAAVDRAIANEAVLMDQLRSTRPVAETYIQDMMDDSDFGSVPRADHYYLGRLDLSHGITRAPYIPDPDARNKLDLFRFFTIRYLPAGFVQMMMIDGPGFNRSNYDFQFARREFLGDIRTLAVTVTPRPKSGPGRFRGTIWIEDRGFNIVRFNGTYTQSSGGRMYLHFDSWRVNAADNRWLPFEVFSEETAAHDTLAVHTLRFKALTRFWGYGGPEARRGGELASMTIERAVDRSPQAGDFSPVEMKRAWERQAEDNILDRLEQAGLLAPRGGVDRAMDTVLNNIAATNDLNVAPEVRSRAMLTTPLESFTVGHTVVVSRGLLDTLPDEASLAAVLAHELAHVVLGHQIPTDFAFSDRLAFSDAGIVNRFRFAHSQAEEEAANAKALELLLKSPYRDRLAEAGLYLKAMGNEANRLPALLKPLFGTQMVDRNNVVMMADLIQRAPELHRERVDQVAALPLGSRTRIDPWTDDVELASMQTVPLSSAREKMPFELAPVYLRLRYVDQKAQIAVQR
jgi:hypothetical protein